jgi:hypothetical protein
LMPDDAADQPSGPPPAARPELPPATTAICVGDCTPSYSWPPSEGRHPFAPAAHTELWSLRCGSSCSCTTPRGGPQGPPATADQAVVTRAELATDRVEDPKMNFIILCTLVTSFPAAPGLLFLV